MEINEQIIIEFEGMQIIKGTEEALKWLFNLLLKEI